MLKKIITGAIVLSMSAVAYAGDSEEAYIDFDGKNASSVSESIINKTANLDIGFPQMDSKFSKEWTIMVYVNSKNNLEGYGLKDVNEMEMVGSSDKVNIVVELGRMDGFDSSEGDWKGSRRYLIKKDTDTRTITSPLVQDLGKVDMGDWKHLIDFGKWAKAEYPAKKYMLVVWNHGSGWKKEFKSIVDKVAKGLSYDDETGNHFTTEQLGKALNEIGRLDVYGSDACLMQMVSVDYEIKGNITYIVGSEETEPGDGYTYNTMLKPIVSNPFITAYQAAKILVDAYSEHYQLLEQSSTQSFVRASSLDKLISLMNNWVSAVIEAGDKEMVKSALSDAQSYSMKDNKDLYHFISLVSEETGSADIKEKSKVLMNYIESSLVAYNRYNNSDGWYGPEDYSNSHGIAVYLPKYSYNKNYSDFKWSKLSNWDEFIKWYTAR